MRRLMLLAAAVTAIMGALVSAQAAPKVRLIYSFCTKGGCVDGSAPTGIAMGPGGVIYGLTTFGGKHSHGGIFSLRLPKNKSKWKMKLLYSFCAQSQCADGDSPIADPIVDRLGNVYGITAKGGRGDAGVAFKLNKPLRKSAPWTLQVMSSICAADDCIGNPARMGLSYPGKEKGQLYDGGSTLFSVADGGAQGKCKPHCGTVFQIVPNIGAGTWALKTIYEFCAVDINNCSDGDSPEGDLLVKPGGEMVTGTVLNAAGGSGAIYTIVPPATPNWKETIVHTFCRTGPCDDGSGPNGGVIPDKSGNLTGVTSLGGISNSGVLYKITTSGEQVLHKFCTETNCTDGRGPSINPVLFDANGNIYGAIVAGGGHNSDPDHIGGGTLYKYSGGALQTEYAFCAQTNCIDGAYPQMRLLMAKTGKIYGIVGRGGALLNGAVFEWTP